MEILNSKIFEQTIKDNKVVIVDFFATWCGPCKMLAPILEEVSQEVTAKICKVDMDQSRDLCQKYAVMVVPTIIIFVDGKETEKFTGFMQKDDLLNKIQKYL